MNTKKIRLGINIDHVATIRNARGGDNPNVAKAAMIAEQYKADGITIHLREDRRHIRDSDLLLIKNSIKLPINLEMAPTDEMLQIAISFLPNAVCIVPEKRLEITTEGGFDVIKYQNLLRPMIVKLKQNNIKVSIFVDANNDQIIKAKELNADIIEIHSGEFCHQFEQDPLSEKNKINFERIKNSAEFANKIGLECHIGHGLNYQTTAILAKIKEVSEFNIGHFIIGEAIMEGLGTVIRKMQEILHCN
jgi:pyridoxine 5-phosphate synthase